MDVTNNKTSGEVEVVSRQFSREESYWLEKLSGELVKSTVNADNKGIVRESSDLRSLPFTFSGELFSLLMKLSNASDPKLHMILAAALTMLLYKHTGNNDILVGTPIYKQEIEADFINTLLTLRNRVEEEMTFKELLLQVRQTLVEADENQNFPIGVLLQKLEMPFSGVDFPLFDVVIAVKNVQEKEYVMQSNPNLVFSFLRTDTSIEGELEYNPQLFEEATVQRLIGQYTRLISEAAANVSVKIHQLEILSEEEKKQLLVEFNDNAAVYPVDQTIHRQFEEKAAEVPDNIAVHFEGKTLTYQQLNQRANRLARLLRKNGVTSESVVGILMDRSLDMLVGLMAILKSGGAYLPIDPGLPEDRITYMLEDAGAKTLLTESQSIRDISFSALQNFEADKELKIEVTKPRGHIKNFDSLPMPDRSHVNLGNYRNKIGMASVTDSITIQTTRGCPYECLYCHKIWSKKHVWRSAENIYNEIEYYYRNGVTDFAIIDDCFNLNRENSSRLFRLLIKNKIKAQLFFPNGLRGDIMTPDYIDLMVEAGTRGINLSLETASPRLQTLLKKNLDLDKFRDVVNYIATKHPHIILEMATMHGFPGETEDEAMMTLNFIKDIKWIHFPYIHILKIFPNTEMEEFA
ncbi:MAG: AMP-binding protein, partial [bacterium]|nr:AMP-binding protein [bacterium]